MCESLNRQNRAEGLGSVANKQKKGETLIPNPPRRQNYSVRQFDSDITSGGVNETRVAEHDVGQEWTSIKIAPHEAIRCYQVAAGHVKTGTYRTDHTNELTH